MSDWDQIRSDYKWLKELISDGTCLNARAAAVHAIGVIRQEYEDFKREAGNDMRAADAELRGLRAELAAEKERCAKTADDAARVRLLNGEFVIAMALEELSAAIRASNAAPPQPCSYPQYCGREVCNCPRDAAPPQDKATISTAHFHGKELPLTSVLFALAGQEGNDGDEGSAMQAAGERILALEAQLAGATPAQPEAPISPMAAIAKDLREGTFRGVLPDAAPPNVESQRGRE